MTSEPGDSQPPMLGAYAASRCARRIHNDHDRTVPSASGEHELSAEVQARIDAGIEFEALVRRDIAAALGVHCVDFSDADLFGAGAIAATTEAMSDGVAVILGGQLSDDVEGGRRGRPDALVRAPDRADGRHTYLPVDIKRHKTLAPAKDTSPMALTSPAYAPFLEHATPSTEFTGRRQERDALQLAHYWRMLEACDRNPDRPALGGVIGVDALADGPVVLWHDLTEPLFKTFSRSAEDGQRLRSALERYDHEFGFRSEIAMIASRRVGAPDDPAPLVEPVYIKECDECPWFDFCLSQLGDSDASVAVGRLSRREWLTLRELGYSEIDQLAALDPDVITGLAGADDASAARTLDLLLDYLPEVGHLQNATKRLRDAVIAAQMVQADVYLRRITDGPVPLERADVEIDFDIENDRDGRVYLWGILINNRVDGSSHFEHVSAWDDLDDEAEAELALVFWTRLTQLVAEAHSASQTVKVYHYANPEPGNLRRISQAALNPELPTLAEVNALINETFIDMYPIVRAHFFGRDGLGLKVIATKGAGFSWRDLDPGGLQSITWLEQVRAGDRALIQRVLEYNEDDVRATLALREWLVRQ